MTKQPLQLDHKGFVYERGNFQENGFGWYWWDEEYSDEGACGPFDLLGDAMVSANGGGKHPPIFANCKRCSFPELVCKCNK